MVIGEKMMSRRKMGPFLEVNDSKKALEVKRGVCPWCECRADATNSFFYSVCYSGKKVLLAFCIYLICKQ